MSNVNVLATISTLSPESLAWREATAAVAASWAKVARTHRALARLYEKRDANRNVEEYVIPVTDREEAFDHRSHAVCAEIQSLECRLTLLRDNAEIAEEKAKAALEAAAT